MRRMQLHTIQMSLNLRVRTFKEIVKVFKSSYFIQIYCKHQYNNQKVHQMPTNSTGNILQAKHALKFQVTVA